MKTQFSGSAYGKAKLGILGAFFATCASVAFAQDITLKSEDGSVNLTGAFVAFENDSYIIESPYGPLRVAAEGITCEGTACPGTATDPMVVSWDVSLWGQPRAFTAHLEKLAELLDARTDGKFTLNLAYGGALSSSRQNLDGISEGKFEMAQFCASYHPEKNPTVTVLELPFLGVSTLEQELEVSQAVYAHPATKADMARWNATILMPSPQPQSNVMGTGFPPVSLDSFQSMTIRANGGVGRAVGALGATTVSIPAPELKDALETGTIQAVAIAPHGHMAFSTFEYGTWWTSNLNPGASNCPVVVNTDALNALPDEYRVLLASAVGESIDHYIENYEGATMSAFQNAMNEREIIQISINNEILAEINEAVAAPAAAAWIEENAAKGLPAEELYGLVTSIVAKN